MAKFYQIGYEKKFADNQHKWKSEIDNTLVEKMKKISAAASFVGLTLLGIAWLAEAKLNAPVPSPHLVYNSETKVYQLHDQTQYANQTLEQKMLTIQSINRNEGQLAAKKPVATH